MLSLLVEPQKASPLAFQRAGFTPERDSPARVGAADGVRPRPLNQPQEDFVELNGVRIYKPLVEKPARWGRRVGSG